MRTQRAKSDNLSCLRSCRTFIIAYVCLTSAALLLQEHGLYTLDAGSECVLWCLANNCGADTLDVTVGRNQALSDPVSDNLWSTGPMCVLDQGFPDFSALRLPDRISFWPRTRLAKQQTMPQNVKKHQLSKCFCYFYFLFNNCSIC